MDTLASIDTGQPKIITIDPGVRGDVSSMNEEEFRSAVEEAEQLCPVSNALRGNVDIQLHTSLAS
ncbi:hypothetical protein BH24ACT19_BH24ACT19_16990 [soil metagenome]